LSEYSEILLRSHVFASFRYARVLK